MESTESPEVPKVEPKVEPKGPRGIVGLRNLGNTCYANSAIQALRQITEMTYLCMSDTSELKKKHDNFSGKLFESYTDLIRTMWTTHSPAYISPDAFWKDMLDAAVHAGYEHFRGRQPQDAHEFMMFLLDQFLEGTKEPVNYIIQRGPSLNDTDRRIQAALESWKQNFEKQYTPIVDIWFGLMEYQTECQECKNKTYRYESFNSLKITVPAHLPNGTPQTLKEMLKADWKEEEIEGYHCDKCPTRTNAKRIMSIWRLPRCLIVVQKRFLPDGRKINTPWKNEDAPLCFSDFFSDASPEKSKNYEYILQSLVDHHGSARGGHYTAQGLSPLDAKWYIYDDETTHPIEKPILSPSTYVMIYRVKS